MDMKPVKVYDAYGRECIAYKPVPDYSKVVAEARSWWWAAKIGFLVWLLFWVSVAVYFGVTVHTP